MEFFNTKKHLSRCLPVLVLPALLVLSACGKSEAPAPEAVPTAVPVEISTPEPTPAFESVTVCGSAVTASTASLQLSGLTAADAEALENAAEYLVSVQDIDFGSGSAESLDWESIRRVEEAFPNAAYHCSFTAFGREFSFEDSSMDFRKETMNDDGALVAGIVPCMPKLTYLDMDNTGVSDESMAAIRDANPNVNVVWRIWFGEKYSVRTDVERILASNPPLGGMLSYENTRSLQYCTKVKYLDIGHNDTLDTIDFVAYMPDLEVAVFAMNNVRDLTPLLNCPKLEYMEFQTSSLSDISVLGQLTNLRHLNLCYNFSLWDISPLYNLTELERLWIGYLDPVPQEQIEEMQRRAPNCQINTTAIDPTSDGWRYAWTNGINEIVPRYNLLREQFAYSEDLSGGSYSYYWTDPYFY